MPVLDAYPYLGFALILLSATLVAGSLAPDLRRGMLLAGVGCAPGALLTVSFVPVYWDPVRLGGSWIGVEDVIFSFSTGSLMWFTLFGLNNPAGMIPRFNAGAALRRYFTCGPIFVLLYYGFRRSSYDPMEAAIGGMLILGASMAFLAPQLVPLAVRGAAAFCIVYTAALVLAFQLWPDFRQQWSAAALSGFQFALIPVEELAWALVAGSTYPLVFAFVIGADTNAVAAAPQPRSVSRQPETPSAAP